ncbi:PAN-3 domain-containing protein [Caenorhabditis elegans]|uniref:PAN-3 domain-containing protein n=1 Tax=Caenorhabditis elegans TaxID=6239 RepID=Q9NA49_CAEEL|nr:PAN-3 domain-containing protein [Caenorhabditis elegans]CAB60551.1 PAN-3 domain-containing protein [Caenorhabditis elegans]|eukprot:NP_502858.1 Uncharacterized protein CELE_Y73F8A.23 [Caenorhabditis elegans]
MHRPSSAVILYFIFFMCGFAESSDEDLQMVVIWGAPSGVDVWEPCSETWKQCLQKCLDEEDCVLIAKITTNFYIFRQGKEFHVVQKTKESGEKVAFKKTNNMCKVSMPKPLFGNDTVTEIYQSETVAYKYEITEWDINGMAQWTFDFQYFVQCDDESFVSIRGANVVCITVRAFPDPYCKNRTAGEQLCKEGNGSGITGPYSYDEGYKMTEYIDKKLQAEPISQKFDYFDFWTDGICSQPDGHNITDGTLDETTGYKWSQTNNFKE